MKASLSRVLALFLAALPLGASAADLKISQLTDGSTIQTTDQIPVNRGGANRRVVVGSMATQNANSVAITGGSITGATSLSVASGNPGPYYSPKKVSTYWYVGGLLGQTSTSTNTTPLVNDTIYAVPGVATEPMTITKIGARTSSSNASASASLKVCIYAADGTNGQPGTLLGSTASGVAVTDGATNAVVEWTLDSATAISPGLFWVGFLQTSTTGARFTIFQQTIPQSQTFGTTGDTALAGTGIIWGYTVSRSYASGCVNPFGSGTLNTTSGLAPIFTYQLQ